MDPDSDPDPAFFVSVCGLTLLQRVVGWGWGGGIGRVDYALCNFILFVLELSVFCRHSISGPLTRTKTHLIQKLISVLVCRAQGVYLL
jgi:hypothetical protein